MSILLLLALQAAQPQLPPPSSTPAPSSEDVVVQAPSRPSPQTPATMVVEPVAMMIAGFDADGDGITMRGEMEEGVRRSFAAIAGSASSIRYLAFADWAARYLGDRNALPSPFDVDRGADGQVTLDELQSQFSRLYSRFNTDGALGITRAELLTFRTGPIDRDGPPKPAKRPARPPEARGRR